MKYVKLIYFLLHSTLLFRKEGKRAFAQRVEYLVQAFSYTYILYIPETHVPRIRRERERWRRVKEGEREGGIKGVALIETHFI